jgi:uncharacterized protein YdhG (YjbR/CyaY superfamily)
MAKKSPSAEYLASLPKAQRVALDTLRKQILAAAPGAAEHFGYGLPGFSLNGHPLLYIGAAKNHCAIYGAHNAKGLASKLRDYKQSKGTIQFTPDKPIPAALVKEIVRARVAANVRKWGEQAPRKVAVKAVPRAKTPAGGAAEVDAFLTALKHPLKAEIDEVRHILLRAGPTLQERVKWNAPSTCSGKSDFSAFNLRAKGFVQLVLLFPNGVVGEETGILEGKWADRRFVRFTDMKDVRRKKAALTRVVKAWLEKR